MLADSPVGAYAVKQTSGTLEPLGDIYDSAPYGYVVPKDETDFAARHRRGPQGDRRPTAPTRTCSRSGASSSGGIDNFAVNP